VLDSETGRPLGFASIRIKGTSVGTISNNDGVFSFHPQNSSGDTLMITMLGYKPFFLQIAGKSFDFPDIMLQPQATELREIVVQEKKLTAREIVKRALDGIDKNSPDAPYSFHGFFRESHQEDNKMVHVIEASVAVNDPGYRKPSRGEPSESVILNGVRSSRSYRSQILTSSVISNFNLLVSALRCNPVKYRDRRILSHDFILDSVIYAGERQLYIIHFFTYIPRFPNFERKNTLLIDADNYTIHQYSWEEYAKSGRYSEKPWTFSPDSTFQKLRKRIVSKYEYEEYAGKMYLKYFHEACYEDIYNIKKQKVEFEMLGQTTLVVTAVKATISALDDTNAMRMDRTLAAQVSAYSREFWGASTLLPLTTREKHDLEWEISLEEQFRQVSIKQRENKP